MRPRVGALCLLLTGSLLLLLPASVDALARPHRPPGRVTYTAEDRAWGLQLGRIAKSMVAMKSSCIPDNTVVHSMSNRVNWKLVELQLSGKAPSQPCFMDRFFMITLDKTAFDLCESHPIKVCVPYVRRLRSTRTGYMAGDYVEIVFVKIKSMKAVLEAGVSALFVDADVLLFTVPQLPAESEYDIIAQMERHDWRCDVSMRKKGETDLAKRIEKCSPRSPFPGSNINTGLIGMTPSNQSLQLLEETLQCGMTQQRPAGNQRCLKKVLRSWSNTSRSLRVLHFPSSYADHIWARDIWKSPNMALASYHAHLSGTSEGKLNTLLKLKAKVEGGEGAGNQQVLLKPRA
ncbi:hypothetical protein DUNSADRAFT_9413 [Dunaliella salina]|uniref:Nucleotide-diphospho-sugar transferase domain-containing protein n=1 Tax=Dunaliella salina TaxID=3046 RepID=A0ABQ7GHH8_DUNSA|nr:hypothetical protein DUNSADRAFT_9413 [Dunaliella salina]|eukprot:KAF5834063.1 hypothetical protein DUNSADRAFT_9413 [Dunaliella salina]